MAERQRADTATKNQQKESIALLPQTQSPIDEPDSVDNVRADSGLSKSTDLKQAGTEDQSVPCVSHGPNIDNKTSEDIDTTNEVSNKVVEENTDATSSIGKGCCLTPIKSLQASMIKMDDELSRQKMCLELVLDEKPNKKNPVKSATLPIETKNLRNDLNTLKDAFQEHQNYLKPDQKCPNKSTFDK